MWGCVAVVGVFSIVPTAAASPVWDKSGTNTSGVDVAYDTSTKTTNVTPGGANNVVSWKDFSVPKGEIVQFDANVTADTEKQWNYIRRKDYKRTNSLICRPV